MTRSPRRLLAVLAVAGALPLGAAPAAHAAGSPPYEIATNGASKLLVAPAAAGSTLAVAVQETPGGVEFTPAASAFPAGCTSSLTKTTCDTGLDAVELRLQGDVVEASVVGVVTTLLTINGGPDSDSILVDTTSPVTLAPGAGNDSVTLRGAIGALTLSGNDTGDDHYDIQSTSVTPGGTLALGDGNDVVSSSLPNVTINGGDGNDTLIGVATLVGGAGSDVIMPRRVDRLANGGSVDPTDVDRLSFELAPGPITLQKVNATDVKVIGQAVTNVGFEEVEGTPAGDTLTGVAGPDALFGGAGNDRIVGNGGPDVLDGGPGDNHVDYGWAGASAVAVDLAAGTGTVAGITDTLRAFRAVTTAAGNDVVTGTAAAESFALGGGDDTISAGPGADTIDAGAGNDVLRGGLGPDSIDGGAGGDTVTYDERGPNEPLNITLATLGGDGAAGENDSLLGIEDVLGGASNDVITGDAGGNVLRGGFGLDTIDGGAGADAVYGGEDRDTIAGGAGSDMLFGEGDDDSINAYDGEPDTVDCGVSPDDDAQVDAADSVSGCEYSRRGDVPVPVEGDGDGFVAGFDCNDADPAINPGAIDIIGDGIDQNCDGFDEPVPFVDYALSLTFSKATARGRKIAKFVVGELPANHRVQVSCKAPRRFARRCPFTRSSKRPNAAGNASLTSLFRRRVLPPGTTIELQVTAPGFNGRVRRFTIRAVGAVRDQRLCLIGTSKKPRSCPPGED